MICALGVRMMLTYLTQQKLQAPESKESYCWLALRQTCTLNRAQNCSGYEEKSKSWGFLLHCSEKGDDLEPGSIPQTQQKVYSECNLGNLFMGTRKRGLNLPTGLRRAAPCNTSLDSCTALWTPSFRSHFYSKTHKKLKTSDLLPGFLSVSWEERRIKRCLYILSH